MPGPACENVKVHRLSAPALPPDRLPWLLRGLVVAVVAVLCLAKGLAKTAAGWGAVVFGLLLIIRIITKGGVAAESLLIIKELGVQLTRTYANGVEENQFIDMENITAVIINEGITLHRVVYYMAFVVEGEKSLVVAFKHLQPRLDVLVPIYRSTLHTIFGSRPGGEELYYHSPSDRRRGR